MRHRDDGAVVLLQRSLQPGDGLGVEVVGGLVQQEEVRLGEEKAAEGDPPTLTSRQRRYIGVARRQTEGVHGDLEGALELPRAGGVDLRLEVGLLREEGVDVGVGRPERGADLVVAVDQCLGLAHALGDVARDVLARIELGFLGEVAHREARRQPRLAGVAVVLARHDAQQRGLPRPVAPDDADFGARVERQVDAPQHLAVGRVEALQTAHGVDELRRHGDQCARSVPLL